MWFGNYNDMFHQTALVKKAREANTYTSSFGMEIYFKIQNAQVHLDESAEGNIYKKVIDGG
jgi:hypothetical protein